MNKNKPFSKTEMKLLVFNKVKRGMSYEKACEELGQEIHAIIQNSKKGKKEKKEQENEKEISKKINEKFKEEFEKLADGKKG